MCWELSLFERLFAAITVRGMSFFFYPSSLAGVSNMRFWKKTRRPHVLRLELCYELL